MARLRGVEGFTAYLARLSAIIEADAAEMLTEGAGEVLDEAQAIVFRNLYDSGELHDSGDIEEVGPRRVELFFATPYTAAHEFGLPDQAITPRQRAFFWAQYADTGEDMWKALALSDTYTIPARPYLRPAFDTRWDDAVDRIADEFEARIYGLL